MAVALGELPGGHGVMPDGLELSDDRWRDRRGDCHRSFGSALGHHESLRSGQVARADLSWVFEEAHCVDGGWGNRGVAPDLDEVDRLASVHPGGIEGIHGSLLSGDSDDRRPVEAHAAAQQLDDRVQSHAARHAEDHVPDLPLFVAALDSAGETGEPEEEEQGVWVERVLDEGFVGPRLLLQAERMQDVFDRTVVAGAAEAVAAVQSRFASIRCDDVAWSVGLHEVVLLMVRASGRGVSAAEVDAAILVLASVTVNPIEDAPDGLALESVQLAKLEPVVFLVDPLWEVDWGAVVVDRSLDPLDVAPVLKVRVVAFDAVEICDLAGDDPREGVEGCRRHGVGRSHLSKELHEGHLACGLLPVPGGCVESVVLVGEEVDGGRRAVCLDQVDEILH